MYLVRNEFLKVTEESSPWIFLMCTKASAEVPQCVGMWQ